MSARIDINDAETVELAKRIVVRMGDQAEPEITHVLTRLFPSSPKLRITSVAQDLASKRINAEDEFINMLNSDMVDINIFNALSSADKDPGIVARTQFDPTSFEMTLTCKRTPFKEFFAECAEITCESCVRDRIINFITKNEYSRSPWELKLDRVEQRRVDLCNNCGIMLGKKDDINLQNERLLYTCSNCGHKGWNKAK